MLVARPLAALLGFSVPLILLTSSSAPTQCQRASPSVAQTQSKPIPARLDLYLPPARVTPPAPQFVPAVLPRPIPRSVSPVMARDAIGSRRRDSAVRPAAHAARPARRPGLYTAARAGRLLYRKGYLGDVPVHLVVADLTDPEVRLGVLVARAGIGSTESFASMVHRAQPAAAITGTFFGVHNGLPTGDLVVNGHALYQGFVGTAIAFTGGNLVSFMRTGYKEKTAWRFFDGVVRAGPMLVQARRIVLGPRHEGFVSLSPAARRLRTAVGITPGRKLLLLAVKEPISLWRLAKLMQTLGAYHAVAMDGGSSTGLYFHGRMVAQPARVLTNALVIYASRPPDQQARRPVPASDVPPDARPAPEPSTDPTLVMRVLSAGDSQTLQPPNTPEPSLPTAALAVGSAASGHPESTMPGMAAPSTSETAQPSGPGAG